MASMPLVLVLVRLGTACNDVDHHVVSCVSSIAKRYFAPGQPLVVSTPSSVRYAQERELDPHGKEVQLMTAVFNSLHQQSTWPILAFRSDEPVVNSEIAYKHQSYILLTWPEQDNIVSVVQQSIESLLLYEDSFNHRARFVLVVMGHTKLFSRSDILKMIETLWDPHRIINVLIVLPTALGSRNEFCSNCEYNIINLYASFPYDSNACGQVKQVDLLDQWLLEGDGGFLSNADLFPDKVPQNFHRCSLTIAPIQRVPFVKLTSIHTDSRGEVVYVYEGLEIEYILFLTRAMNITPQFLEPRVGDFVQLRVEIFMEIAQGMVDVTVGTHPIHPLLVTGGDAARPYYELTMRWWVPCAVPATRTEKAMTVFTPSVWLSIVLVFILTAVTFWRTSLEAGEDSKLFTTFTHSFYVVWAVFLSVSVSDLPKTHRLRGIFLLYIWYSFAMSTVFQVFFVSFLVNPGYEKGVNTFEELIQSGLKLATDARMMSYANASGYWEYLKLELSTDICSVIDECLIYLVTHRNITTVSSDFQFEYVLATLGKTDDKGRYLCTIPEIVSTTKFALYVSKGSPLLDRFNKWIQRAIESGIVGKYWSQFIWNVTLQGVGNRGSDGDQGDNRMFCVLTVAHLSVAFFQLLTGHLLSFVFFMTEFKHCSI